MQKLGCEMYKRSTPLKVAITIVKQCPASWSKTKQAKAMDGFIRPTGKPDLSNYIKGLEDALNGIVYEDDSAICEEHFVKKYGAFPAVYIYVDELEQEADF